MQSRGIGTDLNTYDYAYSSNHVNIISAEKKTVNGTPYQMSTRLSILEFMSKNKTADMDSTLLFKLYLYLEFIVTGKIQNIRYPEYENDFETKYGHVIEEFKKYISTRVILQENEYKIFSP